MKPFRSCHTVDLVMAFHRMLLQTYLLIAVANMLPVSYNSMCKRTLSCQGLFASKSVHRDVKSFLLPVSRIPNPNDTRKRLTGSSLGNQSQNVTARWHTYERIGLCYASCVSPDWEFLSNQEMADRLKQFATKNVTWISFLEQCL